MSEELFEKYMQGRLSEEEKKRLEEILRLPAAGREFVEFTREWTLLATSSRDRAAAAAAAERQARPTTSRAWLWAAGAAAALLLMILVPYAVKRPPPQAPDKVVRVEAPPRLPEFLKKAAPEPELPPRERIRTPEPPSPRPPEPKPAPEPVPAPVPSPVPAPPAPKPPPPAPTLTERPVLASVRHFGPGLKDLETLVKAGSAVETGPATTALIQFPDGTLVSVSSDTRVNVPSAGRVELAQGSLQARVSPQSRALVIATSHAEATVLGTRLALSTAPAGTRLEVTEGKVRFTRRSDGASLEIGAGRSAEVSKAAPWQAKPFVATFDFQDRAAPFFDYAGTLDTQISEVEPDKAFGRATEIEVDGNETDKKSLWVLLRWDLSSIPRTSVVQEAVITLNVEGRSEGQGFALHSMLRPWSEEEATWTRPWRTPGTKAGDDRAERASGVFHPSELGPMKVMLNPTGLAVLQAWIRNPAINHGFILTSSGSSDGVTFTSREHADPARRPKLSIRCQPGTR